MDMSKTADQFLDVIRKRLILEHGSAERLPGDVDDKIRAAHDTEAEITDEELETLVGGGDREDVKLLESKYPLLDQAILSCYELDGDGEDDEDDDEDGDEDGDEEEDSNLVKDDEEGGDGDADKGDDHT
jgi:hypothetical protein